MEMEPCLLMQNRKVKVVNEFKRTQSDTGSPEVQVALLTARIQHLTEQFQKT